MDITANSPKTKICSTCKRRKPLNKFHIKNRRKNGKIIKGIHGSCKICVNATQKKEREDNKEHFFERQRRARRNKAEVIQKIKEESPCQDCGRRYPYYVMDFDHKPGVQKFASVSTMVSLRYSMEAIMEEIKKCDLVCANCHRIRTHKQEYVGPIKKKPPSRNKTREKLRIRSNTNEFGSNSDRSSHWIKMNCHSIES